MPAKTKDKAMQLQSVYYGDCAQHLKQWNTQNQELLKSARSLADLIYADPPWNSNADYNIIWDTGDKGHTAQETAFTDIWHWTDEAAERVEKLCAAGDKIHPQHPEYPLRRVSQVMQGLNQIIPETGMLAYLAYMAERLAFCRELLKDTGSIFLHCDPTMSHYLKLVMDAVFGKQNFRNEIVWCYTGPGSPKMRQFNRKSDTIFWYSKGEKWTFNRDKVRVPYKDGKPHTGGFTHKSGAKAGTKMTSEVAEEYESKGKVLENWWTDIAIASRSKKEYRGYPTQKPLKLLKRIIQASTNPGDVVLDPFCGCGTTVVAAHDLGRQFVGIDISLYTVTNVVREWLSEVGLEREQIHIAGIPEDMAQIRQLAKDDKFAFESFAVELCHPGFKANVHQRKDGGIDGRGVLLHPIEEWEGRNEVIVQCKGGPPTIDQVRAFAWNIIKPESHAIAGVFITLEEDDWKPEMRKIARNAGKFKAVGSAQKYPRLQHWHCSRANLRNREETLFEGLPNLPDLAHRDGKELRKVEISVEQSDFWKGTEE